MTTAALLPHGHLSGDTAGPGPSLALAPTRTRTYKARGEGPRMIAQRVLQIVAELPVTPTVRQLYYLLVSAALLPKTEQGYTSLKRQLGRMRKGGVLAYDALIDGTRDRRRPLTLSTPSEALAYAASIYRRDLWATQPVVCEVWAEADTLSQMLWQVTDPWGVTCVVTRGNPSLSILKRSADVIAQRWAHQQRTRIVYVGDFDPAGMDMSDHLHERLVEVHAPAEAFAVERVALTQELIAEYQLPPHEPKSQDSRTPAFIERYGVACVEVDALPPDVLADVVEGAIKTCVEDPARWVAEQEHDEYERLVLQEHARSDGPVLDARTSATRYLL